MLRFDLDGTGDSAGGPGDPDRLGSWRRSVREAASCLRGIGCTSLVVAGVRFGATLALLEGASVGADRIVAWAPVERGRSYVRELRLLGQPVPDDVAGTGGGIAHAGSVFGPATLDELRVVDVTTLDGRPAPQVLVVDRDDRAPSDALLERLQSLGAATDHAVVAGSAVALDRPTEYSDVPDAVVQAISDWVGRSAPAGVAEEHPEVDVDQRSDRYAHRTRRSPGHRAPRRHPDRRRGQPAGDGRLVQFGLGAPRGSGTGVGRLCTGAGGVRLHVDPAGLLGLGREPGPRPRPGAAVRRPLCGRGRLGRGRLRANGHDRIVVAGLCAGAWVALRAARDAPHSTA